MTDIFLLIPDAALREAVAEQIVTAKIGAVRTIDTAQAFVKLTEAGNKEENPPVLMIDEATYDKKTATSLGGMEPRPVLLLLGSEDGEAVTETFAKPFRLGHLIARLRYYLETAPLLRDRPVDFGPYRLEPQNRRILSETGAEPIRLTEKETALLVFLAQRGEPAARPDILAAVWGYGADIDTHTLETHIYQLRRKIGGEENWLVNEGGAYRLARGKP